MLVRMDQIARMNNHSKDRDRPIEILQVRKTVGHADTAGKTLKPGQAPDSRKEIRRECNVEVF
jgi:hypothetical protein